VYHYHHNSSSSGNTADDERVLLGEIAAVAGVESSSRMHPFLNFTAENLELERPAIVRELERNGLQKDDAIEIREALRSIADCYCGSAGGSFVGGSGEAER
jgi:hypothetical protein